MELYWFFLSYARADTKNDAYLKKFYEDLNERVRFLSGGMIDVESKVVVDTIGFFDTEDIEPGTQWPSELGKALRISRTFVCVLTATYLTRPYCGKEWEIFSSRVQEYLKNQPEKGDPPPVIFPVLWAPEELLRPLLPKAISTIQFSHKEFGEEYTQRGLRQFRRQLGKYKNQYEEFLNKLSTSLIKAARGYDLPVPVNLDDITVVQSAWITRTPVPGAPDNAIGSQAVVSRATLVSAAFDDRGPRCIDFIFLAAEKQEVEHTRTDLRYYSNEGGAGWKPYMPIADEEMGTVAATVCDNEKLFLYAVPFEERLSERIKDAESKNRVVILIVDMWSIQLPKYKKFWDDFIELDVNNTAVLVPWNSSDAETVTNQPILEDEQWRAFIDKLRAKDPNRFVDHITSVEELTIKLSVVLQKMRMKVVEADKNVRKVESGQAYSKPTIAGTVASTI
jgi:FxsC-like protein